MSASSRDWGAFPGVAPVFSHDHERLNVKNILILGCGPAGLFAAHAATTLGHQVAIVSKKRKSEMYGAQYLHRPLPGLTEGEGTMINYVLEGTVDQYREKVYGQGYKGSTSPGELESDHLAWDIRRAYDKAWSLYGREVQDFMVIGGELQAAIDHLAPDLVINSVPRTMLCVKPEEHQFTSEDVWAVGDAPERGIFCPQFAPAGMVICDGTKDRGWYRAANVFDYNSAEWPARRKPPIEGVSLITKPLATNCDCFPAIKHVGRYGLWTKGVLSHDAYYNTLEALA